MKHKRLIVAAALGVVLLVGVVGVTDSYREYPDGAAPVGAAEHGWSITPADADLAHVTRALYVGTGGTIVCTFVGDSTEVTFTNVPDGCERPWRLVNISSTGTTATGLVGLR